MVILNSGCALNSSGECCKRMMPIPQLRLMKWKLLEMEAWQVDF